MSVKVFVWGAIFFLSFGCSQAKKDNDIKAMIATKAKQEPAFAGVHYTVSDGVVTLSGSCPTQREKDKVMIRINNTAGVKGVRDLVQIAPVMLTSDFSLQQAADSVLMQYAKVQASVQDSIITLEGEVKKERLPDLLNAINKLKAKGVLDQLAVR